MRLSRRSTGGGSGASPLGLRTVLLLLALGLSSVSATVTFAVARAAERVEENRLQDEMELLARTLEPVLARHLARGETAAIERSLAGVDRIQRVDGAAVYDAEGARVARAGRADRDVSESALAEDTIRSGERAGRYREVDEEPVFSTFAPLFDRTGSMLGILQINRAQSEIAARLDSFRTRVWLAWAALLAVVGAVLTVGYRHLIGRPVEMLLAAMRDLAPVAGSARRQWITHEFAVLHASFDEMLAALEDARAQRECAYERERRLESELQQSERIAEIGRMVTGIAHELGAPLTVIARRAQRVRQQEPEGTATGRAMASIVEECARLETIVRNLLDYSRTGAVRRRWVDLAGVLSRAAHAATPAAQVRGVTLGEDAAAVARVRLHVDVLRLELAVSNLLHNAIRHARGHVLLRGAGDDRDVRIEVEDDGEGVAPEVADTLFEPFVSGSDDRSSTGLGLAIVARVAEEHGGRAWHERPTGGGARFVIALPRSEGAVS